MKCFFDLTCSSVLFILSTPLYVIISLLIILTDGFPIFFKQKRPGLNGRPFRFYKFRTMSNDYNKDGTLLTDEHRITPIGKFLRRNSLDELPSLLNVIKADMSLVGPRPLLMEYLSLYNEDQMKRHSVKPGITGWAQINGRNAISWEEKFQLDIWYVKNRTFYLDLKIFFLTILKVLKKEDISHKEHVTMPKFKGSKNE